LLIAPDEWEGLRDDNARLQARVAQLEAALREIVNCGDMTCSVCTALARAALKEGE